MSNKPFSFTDKDAVETFFGDLNKLVYGINPYEKFAEKSEEQEAYDASFKDENVCEKPHNNAEESCSECQMINHNE